MAFKKIRDLEASSQLPGGSLSKDDLLAAADANGNKTVKVTPQEIIGTSLDGQSSLELDSNGKLKIRAGAVSAEQFEPGALESTEASVSNATSATEMTDLTGALLTISTGNFGKIAAIVITDHPAANDIGPSPREIDFVISSGTVQCVDHGFAHPTATTRHEVTIYSKDGEIPSVLDSTKTYWAQSLGQNSFALYENKTGGTAIQFTDVGSGQAMVRRRNVFALQNGTISGSTYSPNAYNAYWGDKTIVAINNVFSSFEGAYEWILRNNAGDNLVFFIGSGDHPRCNYNQPGSDSGRLEVDREFTNVNKFRITGNRWDGANNVITSGGMTYSGGEPTGHETKLCARLVIYVKEGGLQFWIREAIHRIQFIGWIYDAQGSSADAPNEFYRSGALGTMTNCSWTFINYNGGEMPDSAVAAVGEGTNTFLSGDTFVDYYGGGSNSWSNTITANNVRIITTLQGGRGFLFPHGPSRFAIKNSLNQVMGKAEADWLYVNAAAETAAYADLSHSYQAATALLNEHTFKTY